MRVLKFALLGVAVILIPSFVAADGRLTQSEGSVETASEPGPPMEFSPRGEFLEGPSSEYTVLGDTVYLYHGGCVMRAYDIPSAALVSSIDYPFTSSQGGSGRSAIITNVDDRDVLICTEASEVYQFEDSRVHGFDSLDVYSFDAKSGAMLWNTQFDHPEVHSHVLVELYAEGSNLILALKDSFGQVFGSYLLDGKDGSVVQELPNLRPILINDSQVFMLGWNAGDSPVLAMYSLDTKKMEWSIEWNSEYPAIFLPGTLTVSNGIAALLVSFNTNPDGETYDYMAERRRMYFIDTSSGEIITAKDWIWLEQSEPDWFETCAADDTLIICSVNHKPVVVFNTEEPFDLAYLELPEDGEQSSPKIIDARGGVLYVAGYDVRDNSGYMIDIATGERLGDLPFNYGIVGPGYAITPVSPELDYEGVLLYRATD